jgi:hypothetical protein
MVPYWNAWKVGNWMFGLHVVTCFTFLLTHQNSDMVYTSFINLVTKNLSSYFMKLLLFNGSLLWIYDFILGMDQNKINCTPNLPCLLAIQIDFNYHQNPPWIYYTLNLFPWMTKDNNPSWLCIKFQLSNYLIIFLPTCLKCM